MYWTIITLFSLVIVYLIGKKFHKDLTGEIIIALLIGLVWESLTGPAWLYETENLLFFHIFGNEIPIAIVIGWGCVLTTSALFAWFFQKKVFKEVNDVTYLIGGIIGIFLFCIPSEVLGYNIGLWTYLSTENVVPITNLPLFVIAGWFFFGVTFLATIRLYEDEIEKRIKRKLLLIK